MIGNGTPQSEFGAIPVVDLANQKVLDGITYSWSKRFTLGASATANIIIDTSAVDADKKVVVLPLSFQAIGGGPIFINLYTGTDASADGTLWEGVNRNLVVGGSPQTILRLNPTIVAPGTQLPVEFMIPSDGTPAVSSVGGQTSDNLVFNAIKTKYRLEVINQEAVVVQLTIALSIFEV